MGPVVGGTDDLESLGMSLAEQLAAVMRPAIERGEFAGAATLVWRDDRVAQCGGFGWRDVEARLPVERDTIFRIASMSKPITSTAALMLYDEGRFALEDPISSWAPEFADMRVLRATNGPLEDTVPAERPITFLDLLTHRAGFTYGAFHPGPIGAAYAQTLGLDIDSRLTPDAWIAGLASLPLIDQPGAGFHYGASTDLLGFLIARMAGMSLEALLEERIFKPLGMKDTGFIVPAEKHARRARMYGFDAEGRLEPRPVHPPQAPAFLAERPHDLAFASGGAGLWSTVDDYLAFARMFVSDGAVDGVRLLKLETLKRMTANFLTERQIAEARTLGLPVFAGQGFGLGVAVVIDPDKAIPTRCKGGVGTVGWPGAYGGWWQADPTDGSVLIFLAQNAFEMEQAARGVGLGVYGAITKFHALATATPR
jgi:CubicO group peptidase (beta-lactamase class C family)